MNLPGYVAVDKWLGQGAAPLDPAAMQYRARVTDKDVGDCAGCCFRGQASKVCKAAALAAPAPTGESLPVQGVPEGWQLVPKEATLEMCDATQVKIGGCYSCSAQIPDWGACKEIYADMLSAAPAPTGVSK